MSQNHSLPSRDCAHFAPLLPLAAHDLLSQQEAARLDTHLATCAHCRGQLTIDTRLEAALRHSYAPPTGAPPPFSREEIRTMLTTSDDHVAPHPTPAGQRPALHVPTPAGETPVPQAARPARRWLGGLPALAATLAVIVLTVAIFGFLTLAHRGSGGPARVLDRSKIALLSISMVSASEGWAVGTTNAEPAQGIILHYHQGRWWQVSNPYDTGQLRSVFMLSASDGWIVGDKGTILHYQAGHWIKVDSHVSTALGSIYMVSPTEGWAMGEAILHYQNGAWTQVSAPEHGFIFSISMLGPGEGWAVGGSGTLLHYIGGQWRAVPGPHIDLYGLAMIAENVGWAVGSGGGAGNLLYYQDGTWSVTNSPASQEALWSIAMASPDEGWAVGYRHSDVGLILHYSQGQWTAIPTPTNGFLMGVTLVSPAEGWAVGSQGTILHYLNGEWSNYTDAIPPETTQTPSAGLDLSQYELNSISMVSPDEGWAVGNTSPYYTAVDPSSGATNRVQPIILHYAHGRWTPQQLPDFQHSAPCTTLASPGTCTNIALNSISMVSAREGWAVGSTVPPINVTDTTPLGMLLHYTGGKWALVNIQMSYLKSVYMRSASDGWILGNVLGPDGGGPREVLHYDGHAWTPVSDPTFANITPLTLTGTADGQVWISGVDYSVSVGDGFDGNNPAVLLHYDGTRWSKVDAHIANGRLSSFAFTGPDEGWAVGFLPNTDQHRASEEDGLILHYHNGVWQEQTRVKDPFGQQYFSFSSVAMVSASDGWAVGNEGVIMHYANGTWTPARSPTGENLSSIVMVSSQEGWAIGAHGTIVHYHNGSWKVFA